MSQPKRKSFSEKHGSDPKPDEFIQDEIRKRMKNNAIACAVAFDIAKQVNATPDRVGRNIDLMNIRLIKCQLGLFGYPAKNKIVKPASESNPEVLEAIRRGLADERLPCRTAWKIAARFNISKMAVSSACESLNIKIKPCQLGAF